MKNNLKNDFRMVEKFISEFLGEKSADFDEKDKVDIKSTVKYRKWLFETKMREFKAIILSKVKKTKKERFLRC